MSSSILRKVGSSNPLLCKTNGQPVSRVSVGFGWDNRPGRPVADGDLSCLYVTGDPHNPQTLRAASPIPQQCFFFYNNLTSPDGAVRHFGDNKDGFGPGINEMFQLDLTRVPQYSPATNLPIVGLLVLVSIHNGDEAHLELDELASAFTTVTDLNTGRELNRRDIDEGFPGSRSACIGGMFRQPNGTWTWDRMTLGFHDELEAPLRFFGVQV